MKEKYIRGAWEKIRKTDRQTERINETDKQREKRDSWSDNNFMRLTPTSLK